MGNSNSYLTKEMMDHAVKAAGWICPDKEMTDHAVIGFSRFPPKQGEIFQLHQSKTELWKLEPNNVPQCLGKELFPDGKYYIPYKVGITGEKHLTFLVFVPE